MHVLVVHDDPEILRMAADFLSGHAGVRVTSAGGPPEAVEAADKSAAAVDAMVAAAQFRDGGTGQALRAEIAARHPLRGAVFLLPPDGGGADGGAPESEGDSDDTLTLRCPPLDGDRLLDWLGRLDAPAKDDDVGPFAPGERIGDYEVIGQNRSDGQAVYYKAVQRSVRRPVMLVALRSEHSRNGDAVREFRGAVRAKARVVHPHIAPVFEANEEGERIYFTREFIDGRSLAQLAARRVILKQETMLGILRVAADAFAYFKTHRIATAPLTDGDIFVARDMSPRIANLAVAGSPEPEQEQNDLKALAAMAAPLIDWTSLAHREAADIVRRLQGDETPSGDRTRGGPPIATWEALEFEANSVQQALSDARSLHPPRAADPALSWQRARRRRRMRRAAALAGISLALVVGIGALVMWMANPPGPTAPPATMTFVPSGSFVYQDDETRSLNGFWIDEYEVTIAEYAAFLTDIASRADGGREFDHRDQPPAKSGHVPEEWSVYYAAAAENGTFRGEPIALSMPVMLVDWWDAYAFASWKGRRLPTEEEWEKAARGKDGNLYPWGDELRTLDIANTGADLEEGAIDGHRYWAPVHAFPDDRSEYHCFGMGGNVSEWTATWTRHPQLPDQQIPVVRGASFATPPGPAAAATARLSVDSPGDRRLTIGFRTASDSPPRRSERP